MSVDLALMTYVLPRSAGGQEATGKAPGILTNAIDFQQIFGALLWKALLPLTGNNDRMLFYLAEAFVRSGAALVLPIRSVL